MKNVIKFLAITGAVLYAASKIYQKFVREPEYEEFDDGGASRGFDLEAEEEESLSEKIRRAAKSALL